MMRLLYALYSHPSIRLSVSIPAGLGLELCGLNLEVLASAVRKCRHLVAELFSSATKCLHCISGRPETQAQH